MLHHHQPEQTNQTLACKVFAFLAATVGRVRWRVFMNAHS